MFDFINPSSVGLGLVLYCMFVNENNKCGNAV